MAALTSISRNSRGGSSTVGNIAQMNVLKINKEQINFMYQLQKEKAGKNMAMLEKNRSTLRPPTRPMAFK